MCLTLIQLQQFKYFLVGGGMILIFSEKNQMISIFSEKNKMFLMASEKIKIFTIWPIFMYTTYEEKNVTLARSLIFFFDLSQSRK